MQDKTVAEAEVWVEVLAALKANRRFGMYRDEILGSVAAASGYKERIIERVIGQMYHEGMITKRMDGHRAIYSLTEAGASVVPPKLAVCAFAYCNKKVQSRMASARFCCSKHRSRERRRIRKASMPKVQRYRRLMMKWHISQRTALHGNS